MSGGKRPPPYVCGDDDTHASIHPPPHPRSCWRKRQEREGKSRDQYGAAEGARDKSTTLNVCSPVTKAGTWCKPRNPIFISLQCANDLCRATQRDALRRKSKARQRRLHSRWRRPPPPPTEDHWAARGERPLFSGSERLVLSRGPSCKSHSIAAVFETPPPTLVFSFDWCSPCQPTRDRTGHQRKMRIQHFPPAREDVDDELAQQW